MSRSIKDQQRWSKKFFASGGLMMEEVDRVLPQATSLRPVYIEVGDSHWARLTPRIVAPGLMWIDVVIHFPSGEDYESDELTQRLEMDVADAYQDLAVRCSCGHWQLANHTRLDDVRLTQ